MGPQREIPQTAGETGGKPETIEAKKYFPPLLKDVFSDALPSYSDCPETIDCRDTPFGKTIKKFREEVARLTIDRVKKTKDRGKRNREWDIEYGQMSYDLEGEVAEGEIRQGERGSLDVFQDYPGDPPTRFRKVVLHSHPNDRTLSSADLGTILSVLRTERLWGEDSYKVSPPLRMMIAATDSGTFLTFPTEETDAPSHTEFIEEGLIANNPKSFRSLQAAYAEIWDEFKEKYDTQHLEGTKLGGSSWLLPNDVNDRGIEAISMEFALRLCQKHKLPPYFMQKEGGTFRKVEQLTDYFSDLKEKA